MHQRKQPKLYFRGTSRLQVFPFKETTGTTEHSNDRIYGTDGVGPTLNAMQGGKGTAQTLDTGTQQHTLQGTKIRRLTPTECMRLQGFPDDWCDGLGISDTQKYKVAGNAVTVNVIEAVMGWLLEKKHETPH